MGIKIIFLLFIFYSFLGWLMEVTCKLIQYKRFINRGFLMGPICPIYGHGAIIMLILLKDFASNPFILTYIEKITEPFLSILFYTLLVVYIIDNIISYNIINNFSSTIKKSNYDNTEEVTKYVKDVFLKKNYLSKRLIYAYPNFQTRVRRKLAKIKEALGE